jgi:hypothetical protein
MFLTNHTLTGVLLGLNLQNPVLLAPIALASHFILDALPHYDPDLQLGEEVSARAKRIIIVDALLSLGVLIAALLIWPQVLGLILVGTFFATLPDLLYIPRHFYGWVPHRLYARFHKKIQWAEVSWGYVPELIYAALVISRLAK